MVVPAELRATIDRNVARLLEKYGKVAIWGINYQSAELFKHSATLRGRGVYPIDISNIKRLMALHGKQISPPEAIDSEPIDVVVVAIPAFFGKSRGRYTPIPPIATRK